MVKKRTLLIYVILILIATVFGLFSIYINNTKKSDQMVLEKKIEREKEVKDKKKLLTIQREKLNEWKYPSEKKDYPNLKEHKEAYIKVSLDKQRVYIKDENKILYTMKAATGDYSSPTPKGTFHIQNRGDSFYNSKSDEGANYWTSFKDWGVYLFHTVPTDKSGKYIENEAHKLGRPSSHGCIRLTVPDAKWINESVPDGMKVVILD